MSNLIDLNERAQQKLKYEHVVDLNRSLEEEKYNILPVWAIEALKMSITDLDINDPEFGAIPLAFVRDETCEHPRIVFFDTYDRINFTHHTSRQNSSSENESHEAHIGHEVVFRPLTASEKPAIAAKAKPPAGAATSLMAKGLRDFGYTEDSRFPPLLFFAFRLTYYLNVLYGCELSSVSILVEDGKQVIEVVMVTGDYEITEVVHLSVLTDRFESFHQRYLEWQEQNPTP